MEASDEADPSTLLISVLRHLRHLAANPETAEGVFETIRNAALRTNPSLPYVPRVLSKVSALAISAQDVRVREIATATSACLVSCLSRTAGPAQAGCFITGLCDALSNIHKSRSRGSKSPIKFLEEFESAYVNTVVMDNASNIPVEHRNQLEDDGLAIYPSRQTLLSIIALLHRTMPVPHQKIHRKSEQMYAGTMWVALDDNTRNAVAMQLSHPVLLAGCQGYRPAISAAQLLLVFVKNVCQSAVAKVQMRNRLGASFTFHVHASCEESSPERSELTTILLEILRLVSSDRGICPKVWAEAGVHSVIYGPHGVAESAAELVAHGFIANVDLSEIPNIIVSPSMSSRKAPRYQVPYINGNDGDEANMLTNTDSGFNPYNTNPSLCINLFDPNSSADTNPSGSEQLLIFSLYEELHTLEDQSNPCYFRCFERLCFLTATRCGLWKSKCFQPLWRSFTLRLLSKVVIALQVAAGSLVSNGYSEPFALCRTSLELVYMTATDSPRVDDEDPESDSSEDAPLGRSRKTSHISRSEIPVWRSVVSGALNLLEKTMLAGDLALGVVDYQEIPVVVRLLAQFDREREVFLPIVSPDFSTKIYEVCSGLLEKSVQVVEVDEKRNRFVQLLSCYSAMVLVCPISKIGDANASVERLKQLVVSFAKVSVPLACSSLIAIGHLVCISAKCRGNHRVLSSGKFRPSASDDVWHLCESVTASILKSDSCDKLLGAAAQCLAHLTLHAPPLKYAQCIALLRQCVWHPGSITARRTAIRTIEMLLPGQQGSETAPERGDTLEIATAGMQQDSWDGPGSAFRATNGDDNIATLLGMDLKAQVENCSLGHQAAGANGGIIDQDPRILSLISKLPSTDLAVKKVITIALDALIVGSVNDLRNIGEACCVVGNRNGEEVPNREQAVKHSKFWSELLFAATNMNNRSHLIHGEDDFECEIFVKKPWLSSSIDKASLDSYAVHKRSKRALISELATFLSSRMKDWLPFSLERMLSTPVFSKYIAVMLLEREEDLWKNVPQYALGTVLRDGNTGMLDSLACRLNIPKKDLVQFVCADAIARNALVSPVGIDLRRDGPNKLIQEVMSQPLEDIVRNRAAKIIQRVVMELGGTRDAAARRALDSLTRIMSPTENCISTGDLVSRHFLLVMDAANRVLLYNNSTEPERLRCLCMLESVFRISKENLHMYVPKVFATLKICLNDNDAGVAFKGKTIEAWACFLSSLGAEHVGPHLGSMLALLLPQVPNHADKIVPVVRDLIRNGKSHLSPLFPEILLLFRTVAHPSLRDIARFLEKEIDRSSIDGGEGEDGDVTMFALQGDDQPPQMPSSLHQNDACKYGGTCLQFLHVATRHESSEIRSIALDQLLEVLRANRHHMKTLIGTLTLADTAAECPPPVLAVLANNLISLVSKSTDGCDMKALQCLGELGAIDPALIMPHIRKCGLQRGGSGASREETTLADRKYPRNFSVLAHFLLEVHLAPALWRSDRQDAVGSRLNRVGLAIQELLKACGCRRETAIGVKKRGQTEVIVIDDDTSFEKGNSEISGEDTGAKFWTSLSHPVQIAAQPYLLEPFDIRKYPSVTGTVKRGDIEAACVSIWDKMHVDGKGVVVEDWLRQIVYQAIDFIGGEGKFGALFRAVRPALRYEHGIVSSIFPHVVMMSLDLEKKTLGTNRLCGFLLNELKDALASESPAVQCAFSLLDVLRTWRDERALQQAKHIYTVYRRRQKNSKFKGPSLQSIVEGQKEVDPLSPLVCLDGRTNRVISLYHQAKAALSICAYPRAIMLAEQHVRNTRFLGGNYAWPASMAKLLGGADLTNASSSAEKRSASQAFIRQESVSLSVLQRAFAELEDADSLRGIAALRKTSTLTESIVDAEASGNFDDALLMYERALAQSPGDEKLHVGFLRCLCTLGHWETMLAHATGIAIPASSVSLDSESAQISTRSLGVEAAWRLSRWEHLDELCKGGALRADVSATENMVNQGIINTGEAIGRTLLHVHQKDWDLAVLAVKRTRALLLPRIAHPALEGYARSYPILVQLHALADVEDVAEFTRKRATVDQSQIGVTAEVNFLELARMNCRSEIAATSLRVREPLLSARRACLEMLGYRTLAANVSIELAQLARESGNLRAATAAASHALSNTEEGDATSFACGTEMARIQRMRGDDAGALLRLKKVIEGMTNAYEAAKTGDTVQNRVRGIAGVRLDLRNRGQTLEDAEKRLCAAHVLAGQWIEDSRSESSEVILWHYGRATQYCPDSDQAFYALGRYYDSLLQAGAAAQGNNPESKAGRRPSSSQSNGNTGPANKIRRNHYEYVPLVIQNFSKTLQNGHARLYEALPRLLTIWFDFYTSHASAGNSAARIQGVEPTVRSAMHAAGATIPHYMWMSVVPQLMSRLLHSSAIIRTEVTRLLCRVLVRFPDQCVWLIMPSTQLKAMDRKNAVKDVLNGSVAMARKALDASSSGQSSASRRKSGASAAGKQASSRLRKLIQCGLFVVKDLIGVCQMPSKVKRGGGHENFRDEFEDLRKNIEKSSVIVPTLRALTASLPGNLSADGSGGVGESHRAFAEEPITIMDVDDDVLVMSSLMQPKRVGFTGSDGRNYRFLAKRENNGDMRKDSRLMDFVTVVNRLLAKDSQARERDLQLKTYAVIPLTEETGMIEWVNDLMPLRALVKEEQSCLKRLPENSEITEKYAEYAKNKKEFLENWAFIQFPPMLDKFFVKQFARGGDAATWLAARTTWTRSVAIWSMTGYIVGLGDRHAENILVDTTSGRAVHVDFAMLFDKGLTLKVPEVVPFRLTPNMVGAFGIAGTEGAFRVTCEVSLRVLRGNSDGLMSTLESFLHDPLADWNRHSNRYALETRHAVRNKLRGIVDGSGIALSIQGQVQKLIADATSIENLSQMYIWWSAWT